MGEHGGAWGKLQCRSAVLEHGKFKPRGPCKEERQQWILEMKFFHSRWSSALSLWMGEWVRASRITRAMFVGEASAGRASERAEGERGAREGVGDMVG